MCKEYQVRSMIATDFSFVLIFGPTGIREGHYITIQGGRISGEIIIYVRVCDRGTSG